MMVYAEVQFGLFTFQLHALFLTKVLGYKDVNMSGPITAQYVLQG